MDHYSEVRYEDLVSGPEAALQLICEFLELPFDAAMVEPPEAPAVIAELGPIGGWRERLGAEQLSAFEEAGGESLAELGYPDAPTLANR